MDSRIEINSQLLERFLPLFESYFSRDPAGGAPWQVPEEIDGVLLFPKTNNELAIEFLGLLGALNFSYWTKTAGDVTTWGIQTRGGTYLEDVFALSYAIQESVKSGRLDLSFDCYQSISRSDCEKIFADRASGHCTIPMFEQRFKKIREIGAGLAAFSAQVDSSPTFTAIVESSTNISEFLDHLETFFPYSFGDPFQKLSQLYTKMLIDRLPSNLPDSSLVHTEKYQTAVGFSGYDTLQAQPDYMLPLFFIKTGIWDLRDEVSRMISRNRECPMDHPIEMEIRKTTVKTVKRIASRLDGESGKNRCDVDSIAWITAVEGCFPVDCDGCHFYQQCEAVQGENDRLNWNHHLTRTPHY
ncbi:MAG: queuosine salvage family protein [bacterium]